VETVTLGPQVGTSWVVNAGLSPGAQVIVDNLQKLHDGAPIAAHHGQPGAATAPPANAAGN
jgi:membrane fusion protein (multidrug efflux system)